MKTIIIATIALQALALAGCNKPEGNKDDKSDKSDKDKPTEKASKKNKGGDDDDDDGPVQLTCASNVNGLGDKAKKGFTGKCPAGCTSGGVWGTGSYTTDSVVCVAAVQAGVIDANKGGTVTVQVSAGLPSYKGSTKNGVTSSDWGAFDKTFTFKGAKLDDDAVALTCSDSINALANKVGTDFDATCPGGCTSGSVWGTDVYTTDSPICVAAVHAGATTASGGGKVHVKVVGGKSSYKGSTKNGVKTSDWGSFDKSFTVD
jgi:hypothetical protein